MGNDDPVTSNTDTPVVDDPPVAEPAGDDLTDKHGNDAIARGKYERDIKAKDDQIAELQAKVAEAAKSEETAKELNAEIAALKQEVTDLNVKHSLEMAGCKNTKAAKALLDDYDGDVAKLKEACPYLFGTDKPKGSTGLAPSGKPNGLDQIDKAMGVGPYRK